MNRETHDSGLYSLGSQIIGQGEGTPESKEFAKVAFPGGEAIVVTDLVACDKKVVVVDINGMLWAWGDAKNSEFAFEEAPPGILMQPMELAYLNSLGMRATKISLSRSHLMVALSDWDELETAFYCVGLKSDGKHLGESYDKDAQTMHEQVAFKGRKILDFAAGTDVSLVVVDGPTDKFTDRLYRHELPDGRTARGLIHFYKQGDEWHFVTEDEYEQKKHELPALCFATKCPISGIADRSWLDLAEAAADILEPKQAQEGGDQIDTDAKTVTHKGVKCLMSDSEITGPRYHACYTTRDSDP